MSNIVTQLCTIVDCTRDYFKTDVGKKKLKLLDNIKNTRDPSSGIESTFTGIIAQVIYNMSGFIAETRFTGEDVVVFKEDTLEELFRIELKAGVQDKETHWYTNGATQFHGTHCIFMGPSGLIKKINPTCHKKVGDWVIGVLT